MKDVNSILNRLENAFTNPDRGVVGLVDELLAMSFEREIRLGWQDGMCQVVVLDDDCSGRIELPLRKSVLRAVLARIAVLRDERDPGVVSPYGGEGKISIDAGSPRTIHVRFVNTPETLRLELSSVSAEVVSLTKLSQVEPSI